MTRPGMKRRRAGNLLRHEHTDKLSYTSGLSGQARE